MVLAAALMGSLTGCNDFLDYTPTAVVDEEKAFSEPDKMVNSAYAMLGDCWYSYPFNLWPYGDLSSDDCLKGGSGTSDTGYHDVEIWSTLTSTKGELLRRFPLQPRLGSLGEEWREHTRCRDYQAA